MMRAIYLWSPAFITLGMAGYVAAFGKSDASVVVFLLVLTAAICAHTCQLVRDRHGGYRHH